MTTLAAVRAAVIEAALEQYSAGATVAELARATGIPPATLRERVIAAGLHQPGRRSGPAAKSHCPRAHPYAVHGRPATGGGFMCGECRRISQRVGFPGWPAYDLEHGPYEFPPDAVR